MNPVIKSLVAGAIPALAATALAADAPATQPATEPATQPAPIIAQSNDPLVIPDGTSLENPGPSPINTTILNHANGGLRGIRG